VGACPQQAFNPSDPNPFFSLDVNDELCDNCNFSQTTVSAHFDPGAAQTITLSCDGGCSESSDVVITLGEGISIANSGSRISAELSHNFTESFYSFKLLDFNVAVSTPDSKIFKSNNPGAIP